MFIPGKLLVVKFPIVLIGPENGNRETRFSAYSAGECLLVTDCGKVETRNNKEYCLVFFLGRDGEKVCGHFTKEDAGKVFSLKPDGQ